MKNLTTFLISAGILGAIIGCGGGGGSTFSPTTVGSKTTSTTSSTGTTGTTGTVGTEFAAPTIVYGQPTAINNVSPNGQMVAADANGLPIYYSSPLDIPRPIHTGSYTGVTVLSINNSGQMVGYAGGDAGDTPLYWSSPTATPAALATPLEGETAAAASINDSGAIVGASGMGTDSEHPLYWASSTSSPTTLNADGGASAALRIANTGVIYGENLGAVLVWTSPTANARPINPPSPSDLIAYNGTGLAFNEETGEIGSTATSGGNNTAFTWTLPSYTYTPLPVPSGFTGSTFLNNIGPNHSGVGYSAISTRRAVLWPTLSTAFVDLNTLIPSGTGWTLQSANFETDSGIIVGQGLNPGNQPYFFVLRPQTVD